MCLWEGDSDRLLRGAREVRPSGRRRAGGPQHAFSEHTWEAEDPSSGRDTRVGGWWDTQREELGEQVGPWSGAQEGNLGWGGSWFGASERNGCWKPPGVAELTQGKWDESQERRGC